jgi:hypothetical protein
MHGQWTGKIAGEFGGTLRIELEDRGSALFGTAYLFYDLSHKLPGFRFPVRIPKTAPHSTRVETTYLYADGGVMTVEQRKSAEADLTARFGELPIPAEFDVIFSIEQEALKVDYQWGEDGADSMLLTRSDVSGPSTYVAREDLASWSQFRQWAVVQKPRNYIFRGQAYPHKLTSTFHRTWRSDLFTWIADDVRQLFGALMEKLSYPLQLGNLEHNAAVWSILQHYGYPTPMIDWTFSPFVAAYFAFANVAPDQDEPARIFILDQVAWNERHGRQAFIVDAAPPQMVVLESVPVANPRSAAQQALFTVTNMADVEGHIRAMEQEDGRSYLTVCDLPASERSQIMQELELMGITYGSLFPGIDGVCRDMKDRLFRLPV